LPEDLPHKPSSGSKSTFCSTDDIDQRSTAAVAVVAAASSASPAVEIFSCKKLCVREIDYRCSVCMETFEDADTLYLLPCEHYFHVVCTEGWMAVSYALRRRCIIDIFYLSLLFTSIIAFTHIFVHVGSQ
jgi:hypothetical protein